MKKRYEALLALSTRGKEESAKEIIERLEKTFANEGAAIEQIQRFEKRELAFPLKHLNSALVTSTEYIARIIRIESQESAFTSGRISPAVGGDSSTA